MQELILDKLMRFNKPIKTKQLAGRLDVDRTTLTKYLNILVEEKKVSYVNASTRQVEKICGWIISPKLDHHVKMYQDHRLSLEQNLHIKQYFAYQRIRISNELTV